MEEPEFYDLVFKGELVKGAELSLTKQNMGKLFKIAPDKIDALFTGRVITLKKQLDFEAATRYRAAIKKAGARVDLIATKVEYRPTAPPREIPVSDVFNNAEKKHPHVESATTPDDARQNNFSGGESALGLSIRAAGENLIDEGELHQAQTVSVDISGLSLAAAGEDILRPEERRKEQVVKVNTEQFSLDGEPDAS